MPKKLDKCVKEVEKKIKKREIPKTYKEAGKRKKQVLGLFARQL